MMGMPKLASWEETVDLPVAIPPVRPTTGRAGVSVHCFRGHCDKTYRALLVATTSMGLDEVLK